MKCEKYQKFLSDYKDGSLPKKKTEKIKKHLEQCSECREVLELYKKLDKEIKILSEFEPSSDYWNTYWLKLKAKIESEEKAKERLFSWKINWRWSLAGILAGLLIFVIIFAFIFKKEKMDEGIYYISSDEYLSSFINELEENNFIAKYFEELIFSEMGSEIENLDYFEYSTDFNNIYNLINEMSEGEIEIFNSEIIKELKNKGVKNEIQS